MAKPTYEQLAKSGKEDAHQIAFFAWCNDNISKFPELKWIHHIPNGGSRNKAEAGKFKAMGVKAGVADIFLPVGKHGEQLVKNKEWGYILVETIQKHSYLGLYIEMKVGQGKLSDKQKEFAEFIKNQNYLFVVCYNWKMAVYAVTSYLTEGYIDWDSYYLSSASLDKKIEMASNLF